MIQQLPFEFATVEHSRFRSASRVANDDVFNLAAAELADCIKVGHHVEVIERENHNRNADALRVCDFKEMRGMKRHNQLAVQMRSRIDECDRRGGYLSQDRNEFVEIVGLARQRDKLRLVGEQSGQRSVVAVQVKSLPVDAAL